MGVVSYNSGSGELTVGVVSYDTGSGKQWEW